MSLNQKLTAMKQAAAAKLAPETVAVMKRSREELAASGILEQAAKPGTAAPPFTLEDPAGQAHALAELHREGPLVLAFYRGVW